ncbi:MAG: glycoside hydrolase family 3 N-terminal domain-containing protein [Bacteroidota bacterium]
MFKEVKRQQSYKRIDQKVRLFLTKMTLEEKVGQMTQLALQAVSEQAKTKEQEHILDVKKLEEAIVQYKIGSILNAWDAAFSLEYWHFIIKNVQDIALSKTRLKIPVLYGVDAIHGATYTSGAALFPQALAMGSSFNRELEKQAGAICSKEVRASGIPWNFYPVLDVGRNPTWPRLWETFGEDTFLVGEMGKAYIEGAQAYDMSKDGKLATCLKHFVGYSVPLSGKDRTPAWIGERSLREYLLPPFKTAVDAGAETIMINSAEIDGIPGHANYHLLTEVLRNEWKFKGFTVSDWMDIQRLHTRDNAADSQEEAVRMAVMAGVDMSMVPFDFSFCNILIKLVKQGKVPMKRINEAVSRILRVKFMTGLFDNPYSKTAFENDFGCVQHTSANYEAAKETIILAKNENETLPLSKNTKILVTGPTADKLSVLNGGWTVTWQGNTEELYPKNKMTVLDAIRAKAGSGNVVFAHGADFNKEIDIRAAVNKAKNADIVVLCLGEPAYCETPGNITDLTLDETQIKLAQEISKTGIPIVILLLEGRPRVINKIEQLANAVLVSFLPGMEGGRAIADVLFGDVNPSAKMPISYPRFVNDFVLYDHKYLESRDGNVYNPQFKFGHGLSYTTFVYKNLRLSKKKIVQGESVKVKVDITNNGMRSGKETVLMYLSDLYASVSPCSKRLKGFEKIYLEPKETKTVEFVINPEQMSFIGLYLKPTVEKGKFAVSVDNLKAEFELV